MEIHKPQIENLLSDYHHYIDRIIRQFYYGADPKTKEELKHVGLIGLWKGINAYYKTDMSQFEHERFVNTICAYIRYEISDFFRNNNIIKIAGNQWSNFSKIKKLIEENPHASEQQLEKLATDSNLKMSCYKKTMSILKLRSLDASIGGETEADSYIFIPFNDPQIESYLNKNYINYIIESAFEGITSMRDKKLLSKWIESIYYTSELSQVDLAHMFGISNSMVSVIIQKFIGLCRFVRNCEQLFSENSNGFIYFPKIPKQDLLHNDKKIPGVKWALENRKWKVEIAVGNNKSIFIGYFEDYVTAVKARRNAEIKYRGKSNILI